MIKAVIFDIDGVIIESADIKTKAFKRLFEPDYPEKIDAIVGHHIENMGISRYVKFKYVYENILKLPLSNQKEKELGQKFSNIVLEEVLNVEFVPGACEFLKTNYKNYPLYAASGTPQQELDYIMKKRELAGYFKEIYGSPLQKTDIINNILSENNWACDDVVFVGDALSDLKAARQAGVRFIARITPGSNDLMNCKYRIDNLYELKDLIDLLQTGR